MGTPGTELRNTNYADCFAQKRPSRGIYSSNNFQPSQDAPPPEAEQSEPLATDDNAGGESTTELEQADNSGNDADGSATDSGVMSDTQDETSTMSGGGGGFSLLILVFAVLGLRRRLY